MKDSIERVSDAIQTWTTVMRLANDTQWVLTMRMLGMSGAWSMPREEHQTMIQEKLPAFTEAAFSGAFSAMSGDNLNHVVLKTLEPISSKASANRERLQQRGPLLFGRALY